MYYDVGVGYGHPNYPNYVAGVATSKDGVAWTDSPKSPVKVGNEWRLYYNGWTKVPKSKERPVGAEYAIGLAFAEE